jgi:hypothetical protein
VKVGAWQRPHPGFYGVVVAGKQQRATERVEAVRTQLPVNLRIN